MAVAFNTSDSLTWSTAQSSRTVDITAATIGSWVYFSLFLWETMLSATAAVTFTGWTRVLENELNPGSGEHFAVFKRQKIAGDTTFTPSWDTAGRGEYAWTSYTGLGTTPDEQATFLLASSTSISTPSLTPSTTGCWAWMTAYANSSTTTHRTFTPDGALTERKDVGEDGRGTSTELADSNGTVTVAAHSYTATASGALSASPDAGGAILMFLLPAPDLPVGVLPVGF